MDSTPVMRTYTASYLYRKTFMFRLLWIICVIALLFVIYNVVRQAYYTALFDLVLSIGSALLLYFLPKVALQKSIMMSMILTYSVIFLCMNIDIYSALWMLTLPAFCFATLKKEHIIYANAIGFSMILTSLLITTLSELKQDFFSFFVNLSSCYLVLTYTCFMFHQLIVHYRDELAETIAEKRKLQLSRTLSSGIAHLINNKMAAITGYASILDSTKTYDASSIQKMSDAAFQASKHANDLLAYAEQTVMDYHEPIHLSRCIETILEKIDISENIDVRLSSQGDIPLIKGNRQQVVDTVLDNILINAVEANVKSRIHIHIHVEHIQTHEALKKGAYVRIDISDDGEGMSQESIQQAFDPFYSTKFLGRGMGLAAAFGAMQRHQGFITLQSIVEQETTCSIWLPIQQ